ncbi:MAG: DUF2341 domain-containing protein [Candidatus Heimdallarchaeota archaeon]|nr:MAG: DUF2341 domain-containing protein [Candidatus Heimdallarchaeota archaeon]
MIFIWATNHKSEDSTDIKNVPVPILRSITSFDKNLSYTYSENEYFQLVSNINHLSKNKSMLPQTTEPANSEEIVNFNIKGSINGEWADTRWNRRKNITIDQRKVNGDLTNFTLLLDIFDADLQEYAQEDGGDIIFTQASGEKLNHEIEIYDQTGNSTHAHLVAWVQVDLYSYQDTYISMYFGNSTVSNQEKPENVWSNDYISVWHLSEIGNGSINEYIDSTAYNNHGQGGGGILEQTPNQVPGQIGMGQFLDGIDDLIQIPSSSSLSNPKEEMTIEGWVYSPDGAPGGSIISSTGEFGFNFFDSEIWILLNGTEVPYWHTGQFTGFNWHHYVFTYDGNLNLLYIDGEERSGGSNKGTIQNTEPLYIGWNDFVSHFTKGIIDEVRISNITKSPEWIMTEYNNQFDPYNFYFVGPMEIYDEEPPLINDFGVDDLGDGSPQFWVDITDEKSSIDFVTLKLNQTSHNMTFDTETNLWIYQPSIVAFRDSYFYEINNASDIWRNYLSLPSSPKFVMFNYDSVHPNVLNWEYFSDEGEYGTFKANVSDSWGVIDTVIVNITQGTVLEGSRWAIMQVNSTYINDTIILGSGLFKYVITANDTAGNSFTSSEHQGTVPITNHAPIVENITFSRDPSTPLLPVYSNNTLYLLYDFYDQDNDTEAGTEIRWFKDGVLKTAYNDMVVVPSTAFVKNNQWNVTIRPKDGLDFGNMTSSDTITIQNTAPTASGISITLNPTTCDDIEASWTPTDQDGDNPNDYLNVTIIHWFKWNGSGWELQSLLGNSTSVGSGNTTKDDNWHFTVKIFDGEDYSIEYSSSNTIVVNSIPVVIDPVFNVSSGVSSSLSFKIDYTYNDIDNDLENSGKRIVYWYINGTYNSTFTNFTVINSIYTHEGDFWQYKIAVYDGYDYSINYTSSLLGIGDTLNTPPTVTSCNLTESPTTIDYLIASYIYYDNDGHFQVDHVIHWFKNSILQPELDNLTEINPILTSKHEVWNYTLRVYDGLNWSIQYNSSITTILNSLPEASDLTLTSNPTTVDDLVISWDYTDNDNDPSLNYLVKWFINNIYNASFDNHTTISSNITKKGEEWNYTLRVFDGENYSIQYNSSSTIVINTLPVALNVSLNENPLTNDNLTVNYTYYDADGDNESSSWRIRWYKNNELLPELNDTMIVNFGNTTKNEIWYYKIQISDGEDYSNNYYSTSRIIENTPPILSNLSITPNPTTITALEAFWSFHDDDGDFESIIRIILWYRDHIHQPSLDNRILVPSVYTSKGELWHYGVKVFDGTDYSVQFNSTIISILNSPPTASSLSLTDFPTTNDYLYANWIFFDLDNDVENNNSIIRWFKNGELQSDYNNLHIIPSIATSKGDTWNYTVCVYDGTDYSIQYSSPLAVIRNSAPTVNNIQIKNSICPEFQVEDVNLNITYHIDDLDNDTDFSLIRWYVNGSYQPQFEGMKFISANNTNPGEIWTIEILPFDGSDYGPKIGLSLIIESRPTINDFYYKSLKDLEGHYLFQVNVTDPRNPLKNYDEVVYQIYVNNSILLQENLAKENETTNLWELDFQLENYFYIGYQIDIVVTATTVVKYSNMYYDIKISRNFSLILEDVAPPRILNIYHEIDNEDRPTNITFYVEIQEFGLGVFNVTLFYRYESINSTEGGNGAQEILWYQVPMVYQYENISRNSKFYSVTVDFSPALDTTIFYRIQAADYQGNVNSENTPFNFTFKPIINRSTIELSDLLPLLVLVGVLPAFLITAMIIARKYHQTRVLTQKRKKKKIIDRISDILSLRVIICRNKSGIAFFTNSFAGYGQDEDMIAGITSAMTSMVSEIAERKINSGEYDILEREGFSILSYHGKYSTISMISEEKLSLYMKKKMQKLAYEIENHFTQEELEGLITPELSKGVEKIVLEILPIRLLRPLIFDQSLFITNINQFSKYERKMSEYISEIPSFIDGQHTFYAINFISSLTVQGVPLIKAFNFLEHCYKSEIIRNLSEEELTFLGSVTTPQ